MKPRVVANAQLTQELHCFEGKPLLGEQYFSGRVFLKDVHGAGGLDTPNDLRQQVLHIRVVASDDCEEVFLAVQHIVGVEAA